MAVSAFQKVLNKLFREFALRNGREPQTPKEYMDIQNKAVQFFNRTKGVPPDLKNHLFKVGLQKLFRVVKKKELKVCLNQEM